MACQGLGHLGVRGLKLTLADPGLISSLLAGFDLSERAKSFLIGNLPQLRGGTQGKNAVWEQAQELGLQPSAASPRVGASLSGEPTTQPLMRDLLAQTDPLGSRSLEEIMTGYLRKQRQQEDPARFRQALDFLAELGQVQGAPEPALQEAGSLLTAHHLDPELLRELRETIRLLLELDLGDTEMKLDFALVPELAYYSGIVLRVTCRHTRRGPVAGLRRSLRWTGESAGSGDGRTGPRLRLCPGTGLGSAACHRPTKARWLSWRAGAGGITRGLSSSTEAGGPPPPAGSCGAGGALPEKLGGKLGLRPPGGPPSSYPGSSKWTAERISDSPGVKSMLRLALPSDRTMEEPTLEFLRSCGLAVERPSGRSYTAGTLRSR